MQIRYYCGVLLFLAMLGVGPQALSAPKSNQAKNAPERASALPDQLMTAIRSAKSKLDGLSDVQSKIFDEEVVPQYSRFIRDYRPAPGGVVADIDLNGIRRYISYTGLGSKESNKILVYLKSEKGCDFCASAVLPIKKMVSERLVRRGFVPIFATAEEMDEGNIGGAALNERLTEVARKKRATGGLLLQWQLQMADIDSAHADEKNYQVRVFEIGRVGGIMSADSSSQETRSESALEIRENDSMLAAAERVFVDALSELGSRAMSRSSNEQTDSNTAELRIVVGGVRQWAQYQDIKNKISTLLGGWDPLEERKLSRGTIEFGVRTKRSAEELGRALASLGAKVQDTNSVRLEAQ